MLLGAILWAATVFNVQMHPLFPDFPLLLRIAGALIVSSLICLKSRQVESTVLNVILLFPKLSLGKWDVLPPANLDNFANKSREPILACPCHIIILNLLRLPALWADDLHKTSILQRIRLADCDTTH